MMNVRRAMTLLLLSGACAALLAGCSGSPSRSATAARDSSYARPHRDGAPWWDVDVSKIPDAVPTPYAGPLKANPYTVMGQTYFPLQDASRYSAVGTASWYGTKFHGQATANGEAYDLYGMTAAHKTLPLPCYVRVTNLDNGRSVILRVNDRGPFYSDRIIDLSFAAAKKLGYAETGTARVKVEGIDPLRWQAGQGQTSTAALLVMAPDPAVTAAVAAASRTPERWTPPPAQHAAAVVPGALGPSAGSQPASGGLFIQVGAFANPDAAELLKDRLSGMVSAPVFISPVVRNQQVYHRVRLGPVASASEAARLEDSVRLARLGEPRRVSPDY